VIYLSLRALAADIDLSLEGDARQVSRQQALLRRDVRGVWWLENVGKGTVYVNGSIVNRLASCELPRLHGVRVCRACFPCESRVPTTQTAAEKGHAKKLLKRASAHASCCICRVGLGMGATMNIHLYRVQTYSFATHA
jgi:hypothetical protein